MNANQAQTQKLLANLKYELEFEVIATADEIVNNLRETTPVDTGWAKNSWIPSLGTYAKAPVGDKSMSGVAMAQASQSAGMAALFTWELGKGPIFIVNNTPYINRLNEGWSGQAPKRFVEAAVMKAIQGYGQKVRMKMRSFFSGKGSYNK